MNERIPQIIIVELLDGTVISAELVKVTTDANLPISVALYKQQVPPGCCVGIDEECKVHEVPPVVNPEEASLAHATWAIRQLNKAMGL